MHDARRISSEPPSASESKRHCLVPLTILTIAALGSLVFAQSYTVSPTVCAVHEGGQQHSSPFSSTFRYQQAHGDLKGSARVLTGLAWRREGTELRNTQQVARTFDTEMFMGDCTFASLTATFASNYASAPTNVVVRKSLNLPDHVAQPDFQPAPWTIMVALDTPF